MWKHIFVYLYILEVVGAENYRNYTKTNASDKLPRVDLAWGICLFNAQISDLSTPHLHPPTPYPPTFSIFGGRYVSGRKTTGGRNLARGAKRCSRLFALISSHGKLRYLSASCFDFSTFYSCPIYGTQMNDSENETHNSRNNKKYKVSKNCFMGRWLHNASGFQNKHDET